MKNQSANICQEVKPDYEITIGIKKGEVIKVDFSAMHKHEKNIKGFQIYRRVLKYLKQTENILLKK